MTLPSEEELPLIKSRAEARQTAIRRLIALHQTEYDDMHREERIRRGLPGETDKARMRDLERENAHLREVIAKYESGAFAPEETA